MITKDMLDGIVCRLNTLTNNPLEPYTRIEGRYVVNVGHYQLDYAYGGVQLEQINNDASGTRTVSTCGYVSKPTLYNWISAYIRGIETGSGNNFHE